MEPKVYRTPEPFLFMGSGENGATGILMVHGFTGTPSEFRRVGYFLHEQGYTIQAIRLPGHGTSPEDMLLTEWTDWYKHVRDSFDTMATLCKSIIVMGHSMGGLLALRLATERQVAGIVSLATPIFLASRKTVFARPLQLLVKYVKKPAQTIPTLLDESCAYTKTPIRCVISLRKLLKKVKRSLSKVEAPVWIGQGEKDKVVLPRSAAYLYRKIGSSSKAVYYYPYTSHGMLLDQERERIYEDISAFIQALHSQYSVVRNTT